MERHSTDSIEDDQSNKQDTADLDEDQLLCGYRNCTPKWLQCFHTSRWLLVFLGLCAFIQSFVVNAIFPVGLSTLERRFHMTSTHTGVISSWYDFAVLLIVFPVCHWGNEGHKGRWIGIGGLIMAAGSAICALPHWIVDPYQPTDLNVDPNEDFGQCYANRTFVHDECKDRSFKSYLNPYFWLFILGQTLHGLGSTPLFSIGTAYIDENVSQKASPMFLAINAVITSMGPAVGLFAGGFLLRIYDDFDRVTKVPLKDNLDPRWIGAWWIGFVFSAISAFFVAIPILAYARQLPEARRHRAKDVNQTHQTNVEMAKDQESKWKLWRTVIGILRNPTFNVVIVLGIFESIIINGFAAFMPKILETLLATTPTIGAYLSSTIILACACGVLLGGAIVRKLNLQVSGMLKMVIVCQMIALIFVFGFIFSCPQRNFAGISVNYSGKEIHYDNTLDRINETCNLNCKCQRKDWNPVCQKSTGLIFYSPCFAGCSNKEERTQDTLWKNCGCAINSTITNRVAEDEVVSGYCSQDCGWRVYGFLLCLFVTVLASFAAGIPTQQIMLRVVPFDQRTIAIGLNWTFLRLLGFIPGGILFGVLIDNSCIKWGESVCKSKTSCLVYDPFKLAWTIMALSIICKLVCILGAVLGYMTYRPNDLDNGMSVQTTDSRGPLSLVVNDDRPLEEIGIPIKISEK
ncbi:unnamed protein product, partial [Mesorhabditis belari]|uniref:Solute carrier organic anion transporter family member n=1 Tax=Mesorhabditis belari TaxID=2138241 RepID=A0AAF3E9P0_9BILA